MFAEDELEAQVVSESSSPDSSFQLILAAALLKSAKFDFVIQKAAELGVSSVVPVMTERAVPDIKGKESAKLERWQRIAHEASKQCLRRDIMKVEPVLQFNDALAIQAELKVIAHP